MLHPCQRDALERMTAAARVRGKEAREGLAHFIEMCDLRHEDFVRAVSILKGHARVALNFHPDRPGADQRTVVESLLATGSYRNQFETQLSNGNLSPFPGGERDVWEREYFDGAYHVEGAGLELRPKYGALDLFRRPDGAAPRFGSCFLVLRPEVTARCSFSYLDSHLDPRHRGTLEEMEDILFALFTHAVDHEFALGETPVTPADLVERLTALAEPRGDPSVDRPSRNLNHYVEAQIHGSVEIAQDVELLVADPSFRGSRTGDHLEELAGNAGIPIRWNAGYSMAVGEVPANFRGPRMPPLARRLTQDRLDARILGEAARDPTVDLQDLKRLWHVLVKFGRWGK